jgi:hypothetical protein
LGEPDATSVENDASPPLTGGTLCAVGVAAVLHRHAQCRIEQLDCFDSLRDDDAGIGDADQAVAVVAFSGGDSRSASRASRVH